MSTAICGYCQTDLGPYHYNEFLEVGGGTGMNFSADPPNVVIGAGGIGVRITTADRRVIHEVVCKGGSPAP